MTTKVLTSEAERESTIVALKSIHHDMMKCVRILNTIFGLQTMLCIGITFLFSLFTLFASYKAFYYHDIDVSLTITSIYWAVFYNYFKISIVFICSCVTSEVQTLSTLTYKMMNRKICSPVLLQAFGYQVQQLPSKASCGLFNFDYSLIMMVS